MWREVSDLLFSPFEFQEISVRNVHDWTDRTMNLTDFVEKCRSAGYHATADGRAPFYFLSASLTRFIEEVRLYGKDTECPKPWEHWLKNGDVIPSSLVGNGPQDLFRYRPESVRRVYLRYLNLH